MLRWALASGAPVAGLRTPKSDSILAEAGYLVATGDARALAGACLTLIVERGLAAELKDAGLKRAERFHGEGPVRGLLDVLTGVASG
jgi:glycosyltransferase involved in cell wall biosynthesis